MVSKMGTFKLIIRKNGKSVDGEVLENMKKQLIDTCPSERMEDTLKESGFSNVFEVLNVHEMFKTLSENNFDFSCIDVSEDFVSVRTHHIFFTVVKDVTGVSYSGSVGGADWLRTRGRNFFRKPKGSEMDNEQFARYLDEAFERSEKGCYLKNVRVDWDKLIACVKAESLYISPNYILTNSDEILEEIK